MKIRNGKGKYAQRKAISPIIATVLIIAVTLIAAVAIGGFVFGIFGTASQAAQVSVTSTALTAGDFLTTNSGTTFTCGAATGSHITLSNSGTAGATVTGVTITWAGSSNAFTVNSGTCTVNAAGNAGATTAANPISLLFTSEKLATASAVAGQPYSGTVTLSNGAQLLFTGTFQ